MASLALPWLTYNAGLLLFALRASEAWITVWLVVAGGILSILSRYGGLLTIAGVWTFLLAQPLRFLTGSLPPGSSPSYYYGEGFWLTWAGATISLLGGSWTLPFGLPKTEANRKKLGMMLFPAGVVTVVLGLTNPLPGSIILILGGLIVLGISVVLLLPVRGQTLIHILTGHVRGNKHGEKKPGETSQ